MFLLGIAQTFHAGAQTLIFKTPHKTRIQRLLLIKLW